MANWNRTCLGNELKGIVGDIYQGRPIISRDSPIDGGVYLGKNMREAIVVDSVKFPRINQLYELAKFKSSDYNTFSGQREVNKFKILRSVHNLAREVMPPENSDKVDELIEGFGGFNNQKVALDVFLNNHLGKCRHYALTNAVLLEKFKKDNFLSGTVSVDRNSLILGGHAWCRYTNSEGRVYVLDGMNGFLGTLEESLDKPKWDYRRPGELAHKKI